MAPHSTDHPTDDRPFLAVLGDIIQNNRLDDLRKYQLALLEALRAVDRLCREHDIVYWLDGGTLLGAVRHGGFIPWDDDVDIVMPRAEYQRFRVLAEQNLPEGLVLETRTRHLGLYHSWTRVLHLGSFAWVIPAYPGESTGFYVDIFPVDTADENAHLSLPSRKLNQWFMRIRRGLAETPQDGFATHWRCCPRGYCAGTANGRAHADGPPIFITARIHRFFSRVRACPWSRSILCGKSASRA